MDLARIDEAKENAFVQEMIGADSWIGANDRDSEGSWVWVDNGEPFWTGGPFGEVADGAYENWDHPLLQPDGGTSESCGLLSAISGLWFDQDCSNTKKYVCEEDLCPSDPDKEAPGQCGCGAVDNDSDGDGAADCVDECPSDPKHVVPGQCGCLGAHR